MPIIFDVCHMPDDVTNVLEQLIDGNDLSADEMRAAISEIMDGQASEALIAALLTALAIKGESIEEIIGVARAMRDRVTRIECSKQGLLDTCGTGGDESHTFNISTATALVAAAAGVPVAKHGNRSVSSTSGAADVLEELGVNISLSPLEVARCVDEIGIGFCFARLLHGAMKHAAPVRKQLGFRTIFNLVGPLTNPAGAEFQLVGANRIETAHKLAQALARLGSTRSVVVCGNDELDEVALWGETSVFHVADGDVNRETWTPASFGLSTCRVEDLRVDSPRESAALIRGILEGKPGPARDIVVANASAAFFAAGKTTEPMEGAQLAARTIDSGDAATTCQKLIAKTTT